MRFAFPTNVVVGRSFGEKIKKNKAAKTLAGLYNHFLLPIVQMPWKLEVDE